MILIYLFEDDLALLWLLNPHPVSSLVVWCHIHTVSFKNVRSKIIVVNRK